MGFVLGFFAAVAVGAALFASRVRRWRRWRRRGGVAPAGARWMLRGLFARLGTSPSQERVLVEDADALRAAMEGFRDDWRSARGELADLLGAADLDAARVDAVLAARQERLADVRRRAAEAVARFHAVLDAGQRQALSRLVREGGAFAPAHAGHGRWGGC
ncbi:MAG TPA: periplasmic heavy metal sensor [Anaeromyxobacteraceae bacterium]|nr:periplasmic heavy metal sensor [Anaeromyxobacteraceae bacterium]